MPKQEAGRISDRELSLSLANRSVRLWDHVVERLAQVLLKVPGITSKDLWAAQNSVLEKAGARSGNNVGCSGHGLGLHLTEPPSNMPGHRTELVPGMIMTIEPGFEYAPGKNIVHQENLAITKDGCELLTRCASREMPIIYA